LDRVENFRAVTEFRKLHGRPQSSTNERGWTLIFLPIIVRRMSIITGRGDEGETDLLFGRRIAKTALRIEALGCVDELNAALGMARASGANADWVALIDQLQEKLIGLMGQLATLPEDMERYHGTKFPLITTGDVDWVVGEAHKLEAQGIRFTGWARPGAEGCLARAGVDFARSVARRAERAILRLHESGEPVPEEVRLFFNKLADLLWILARVEGE
jgi:cob(I)alamin adenosyltransferase